METLTTVDLVGGVLAGNLCTIAVVYVYWKAAKDWENFGFSDALPLVIPLLAITAVFY
jgi:hypothetical protein